MYGTIKNLIDINQNAISNIEVIFVASTNLGIISLDSKYLCMALGSTITDTSSINSIKTGITGKYIKIKRPAIKIRNNPKFKNSFSSLKKLSKTSLSNLTPHKAYVFMNYSHPTLLQRYKNLEENL